MFNEDIFERWLDEKSKEIISKLNKEPLTSDEMIVLVLKAQANHFQHLDEDLRKDMRHITELMSERFEQVDERFEQVDKRFEQVIEQVDKRFEQVIEQVDKRFEQVDKRFEQVDKRFERIYSFMRWQTGIIIAAPGRDLCKVISGIRVKLGEI